MLNHIFNSQRSLRLISYALQDRWDLVLKEGFFSFSYNESKDPTELPRKRSYIDPNIADSKGTKLVDYAFHCGFLAKEPSTAARLVYHTLIDNGAIPHHPMNIKDLVNKNQWTTLYRFCTITYNNTTFPNKHIDFSEIIDGRTLADHAFYVGYCNANKNSPFALGLFNLLKKYNKPLKKLKNLKNPIESAIFCHLEEYRLSLLKNILFVKKKALYPNPSINWDIKDKKHPKGWTITEQLIFYAYHDSQITIDAQDIARDILNILIAPHSDIPEHIKSKIEDAQSAQEFSSYFNALKLNADSPELDTYLTDTVGLHFAHKKQEHTTSKKIENSSTVLMHRPSAIY
jgi:hypothetical protein